MTGRPCDVPSGVHDGRVRLYPCGWRCTPHAPQARANVPPTAAPAEARRTPPAPTVWQITAALRIDCGQGIEIKEGDRAGQIWWKTPPRARYECVACRWESAVVAGPLAVQNFTSTIRDTHRIACTGAITEGAQAA